MTVPRALLVMLLALTAAAAPAAALSPPVSTSFKIDGYEYAFTSTVGSFAGKGVGDAGGTGYWNATVKHDRLGSDPTYVNGGPFAMTIPGPDNPVDRVRGGLGPPGGKTTAPGPGAKRKSQK